VSRRVLLVDDEDDIREIAKLSLESVGGWDVVTARSGAEAITTASGDRFDAILLDVMMPELDGPTTLERLRAAGVGTPVVFLTAKVQPGDRRELEATGAAGILAKPFDPMRLSDELDRVLGEAGA
jgi:two-component system, OmpR family, alkaline phosphatase synthesis response regulator PhoP